MCAAKFAWTLAHQRAGSPTACCKTVRREVIAVDTGYGQIDAKLRADPRVRLLEKTNARYLTLEQLWPDASDRQPISLIAMDVSFISATLVLPAVVECVRPERRIRARGAGEAAVRSRTREYGQRRHRA